MWLRARGASVVVDPRLGARRKHVGIIDAMNTRGMWRTMVASVFALLNLALVLACALMNFPGRLGGSSGSWLSRRSCHSRHAAARHGADGEQSSPAFGCPVSATEDPTVATALGRVPTSSRMFCPIGSRARVMSRRSQWMVRRRRPRRVANIKAKIGEVRDSFLTALRLRVDFQLYW